MMIIFKLADLRQSMGSWTRLLNFCSKPHASIARKQELLRKDKSHLIQETTVFCWLEIASSVSASKEQNIPKVPWILITLKYEITLSL